VDMQTFDVGAKLLSRIFVCFEIALSCEISPLKPRYASNRLHDSVAQKAVIFLFSY
jgi:hypothetical protein